VTADVGDAPLRLRARLAVPAAETFAWLSRPAARDRLAPPWQPPGSWQGERAVDPGAWAVTERPADDAWERRFTVVPDGPERCRLEVVVAPRSQSGARPGGAGRGAARDQVAALRAAAFALRQAARDLSRHVRARPIGSLSVAVTGASGLIGRALCAFLAAGGHRVLRLVRGEVPTGGWPADAIPWSPDDGVLDARRLEGVDAVVHLAGESVGGGRWTDARKRRIRASRVDGTALVARALVGLERPPRVLVAASAVGIYGARGDEPVDESAAPGTGFLPEVAAAWEAASGPAAARGVRVALARLGLVLAPAGGALGRMLPLFRAGLGARLGSGRQMMSWVDLDDVVGALHHAIADATFAGPFNVTAPAPASNADFTRSLARVLGRPAFLPAPGFAIAAALGEMGRSLLLDGARVLPRRLERAGFRFLHPALEPALAEMLGAAPLPPAAADGWHEVSTGI
jgi:uncharacterized protein (TIGR01777 family)